jgi:uncharacterized protein
VCHTIVTSRDPTVAESHHQSMFALTSRDKIAADRKTRRMAPPELATHLDLAPHPEGGWYRRTWTSPVTVDTDNGPRPTATAILYLLDGASRWHRVRSSELWCWHSGSGIDLLIGDAPEHGARWTLNQHTPQQQVPAGKWQAARLTGPEPTLVTCVVSPGFDFADFELA